MCIYRFSQLSREEAATWWSQCNLAKLYLSMALDCSDLVGGGGAQNSRQLFALIVRCGSALLTVADALMINSKRCIYILVSGTRQLLRWQGAQCWLHSVTNPTRFPFGLIVTNPIEKRLIDLLSDCLVEWQGWERGGGLWWGRGTGQATEGTEFLRWFFSKDSG